MCPTLDRHDESIGRHDERLTAIEKRQDHDQGAMLRIDAKLDAVILRLDAMKNWMIASLFTALLAALSALGVLVFEIITKK